MKDGIRSSLKEEEGKGRGGGLFEHHFVFGRKCIYMNDDYIFTLYCSALFLRQ